MGIRLSDSVVKFFVWCGSYVVIFFLVFVLFCFFCACLLYLFLFVFIRIASSSNQRITTGIVKVNIFLVTFLPYSFHWQLIREQFFSTRWHLKGFLTPYRPFPILSSKKCAWCCYLTWTTSLTLTTAVGNLHSYALNNCSIYNSITRPQ